MGWEALSRALQKMSGSSNMPATSEKPPEPSQSTTKTQDLLAFRTIITMLSCIQSSNTRLATKAGPTRTEKDRAELRVLDALSTVLIRRHEITAVVARPHDGINFQVFASVAYPSNAEPLLQPDDKGLWSRICNFTVTTNPRVSKMHTRTDSLINLSSIPVIGDHQDQVPGELVTAAKENSTDVLNIFLKTHWGDESFDTHVWMLKTLLGQLTESQTHLDSFLLYVIAASFRKMDARMTNKRFSTPYFNCLQSQTTFTFIKLPKAGNRKRDEPFVGAISFLAKFSTIPNLQLAAEQWLQSQTIEIYNDTTYMEFHQLLCKLLSDFCTSLRELQRLRTKIERGCESDLEVILKALRKVQAFGHYLRMMVNSSALETHLETIAHLLVVDTRKWWAPEPDSEDSDDMDFQRLKPYSMRKGKPLLPWESYRDWLRLMVHYFDAVHALAAYVSLRKCAPGALSITILSPPLPSSKAMLPWTEMLGNDRFFPTLPGESSGKDFVKFLTNRYNKDDLPFMKFDAQSVIKSAANLQLELEKGPLAPPDSLTKIDALAQMVKKHTDSNEHDVTKRILEEILALKDVQPEGQPAALQAILEMLRNLSKRISFYNSLKQGSLRFGTGFPGNHHCEAYLASLLTLLVYSEESASDSETLDILSKHPQEMELLLFQIKDCGHTIGVSKRCCPVCAFLLHLLNKHCGTKFIVSDEHSNISSCALPEWLPGNIVHLMVVEFSRRLREELGKFQESISELRGRAGTSDTGRMSMDSTRSLEREGPGISEEYATEAFA